MVGECGVTSSCGEGAASLGSCECWEGFRFLAADVKNASRVRFLEDEHILKSIL